MRSRSLIHLAALGVVTLLAIALLASTSVNRNTAARDDLERMRDRTLTALDGLTDAEVSQSQVSLLYVSLLAEATVEPATLNAVLDQANGLGVATNEAWARFSRASLGLPGEDELRAEFETGLAAGTASGTELGAVVFGSAAQGDVSAASLQTRLDAVRITADGSRSLVDTLDQLIDLYQGELDSAVAGRASSASAAVTETTRTTAAVVAVLLVAWLLVIRSSRRRDRDIATEHNQREVEARRNELESRLQRGLAMAPDEGACLGVVELALREVSLDSTEVLVADSSRAHFHQVVSPVGEASLGCGVSTPNQCPATRTGQTQTFAWSETIDACPFLRAHPKGPCSAVCAPINIAGVAVGVMSATGARGQLADADVAANLELVARKTGERLGALRTFSKSEIQARTDALTGLLNRRSVESEAGGIVEQGGRYAVAFADLDHFKQLNDVYGHDTGDRALRLFARVLRDSLRPQDVPARWGGEEFVIVLPGCASSDAVRVVDRVRQRLADTLEGGSTPAFTVSFGVASDDSGLPFADLVSMADAALLSAKAQGRDCTVVGGTAGSDTPPAAPEAAPAIAVVRDVPATPEVA